MRRKNHLSLKIFFLIIVSDVLNCIAQVFMKKGLISTKADLIALKHLSELILRGSCSPILWLGIFIYIANFFIWIIILSRADLSIAIPLGSLTYALIPLLSVVFLNEKVSLIRWLGVLFIIAGVCIISRSKEPIKGAL